MKCHCRKYNLLFFVYWKSQGKGPWAAAIMYIFCFSFRAGIKFLRRDISVGVVWYEYAERVETFLFYFLPRCSEWESGLHVCTCLESHKMFVQKGFYNIVSLVTSSRREKLCYAYKDQVMKMWQEESCNPLPGHIKHVTVVDFLKYTIKTIPWIFHYDIHTTHFHFPFDPEIILTFKHLFACLWILISEVDEDKLFFQSYLRKRKHN